METDAPKPEVIDEPRKKGTGRRSNFFIDQSVLDEVTALSNRGLNQKQIRDYFGVSASAWNRKCKAKPELRQSYAMGKSKGIAFTSGKLMELVKKGNLTAIMYYLDRIGKWSNNPEIEDEEEVAKPSFTPIIFAASDPIEAARIYQKIMQGSNKNEQHSSGK